MVARRQLDRIRSSNARHTRARGLDHAPGRNGTQRPHEAAWTSLHTGVVARQQARRLLEQREGRGVRALHSWCRREGAPERGDDHWRQLRAVLVASRRKIAYFEDGAIFTVELGGGPVEKLTDNETNDSSPVWNPQPPSGE
jgi:hypothetical protein